MDEQQKQMVINNRGLVHYIVKKMNIPECDYDDIVSTGIQGLIKAAQNFDETKGIKFATYAGRCINNEIFMYFRKEKKHDIEVSFESVINTDIDGKELTLTDILFDPDGDFTQQIEIQNTFVDVVNFIMNALNRSEKIAMLYKLAGFTQREIGETLKITQSYVSRLIEKARTKVKAYLEDEEQNNTQRFKEVFRMSKVNNLYKIEFSCTDVKNFNKNFSAFILKLATSKNVVSYQVSCDAKEVTIILPAIIESFEFIAKLIEEISEFTLKSNFKIKKQDSESIPEMEELNPAKLKEMSQNFSEETSDTEEIPEKVNKVETIRSYILSVDSFTLKELRKKFTFPKADSAIANTITACKNKGLIVSEGKGKYSVRKK